MSNATSLALEMSEKTYKGNDLLRGERLQVMLEADELRALDDFRFAHRMPSRAAAVRELLRRGLAVDAAVPSSGNGSSQSFGVLDSYPTSTDEHSEG